MFKPLSLITKMAPGTGKSFRVLDIKLAALVDIRAEDRCTNFSFIFILRPSWLGILNKWLLIKHALMYCIIYAFTLLNKQIDTFSITETDSCILNIVRFDILFLKP